MIPRRRVWAKDPEKKGDAEKPIAEAVSGAEYIHSGPGNLLEAAQFSAGGGDTEHGGNQCLNELN
jgi:hypothetical protein